jgi:hypothetical protein
VYHIHTHASEEGVPPVSPTPLTLSSPPPAAVCGGGLHGQLLVPGGAGAPRAHPLQLGGPAGVQRPAEGGEPLQGGAQQAEEAEEQTKTLPTYVLRPGRVAAHV